MIYVTFLILSASFMLEGSAALVLPVDNFRGSVGPTQVRTTYGDVQGYVVKEDNARVWQGIPYAAPPVGTLRWTSPSHPEPWTTPKNVTSFKPGCPQACNLPPLACQKELSEDCLYINVYSPLEAGVYPVMVFFHGGRFEQGSEGVELYNGQRIAGANSVVVVTVNYRIGVLGFLTLPDLSLNGNFGLQDQRFALKWVQSNIARFSGNPNQVTIFGQSAGATSVSCHLVSPQSKGLFHGAVIESSPYSLPLLKPTEAAKHYDVFAKDAGCSSSDKGCLYSLTSDEVVAAEVQAQQKLWLDRPLVMFFPWTPNIDGNEMPDDPFTAINAGNYHKVPVMIGNVAEEGWIFVFEAFPKLNRIEAAALVDVIFGGHHEPAMIFEQYPLPPDADDYRPYIATLASDFVIDCSSRNVSLRMRQDGVPVYHYVFDHAWDEHGLWGPNYTFCEGHVCHGAELPFVFDSAPLCNVSFDAPEQRLSSLVSTYWTKFATNLAPGTVQGVSWPLFNNTTQLSLNFTTHGTGSHTRSHIRSSYCDFWDSSPKGYIF